jgi:hypothetical protein
MFCPKCSQVQPSEHQRFCSRCGFRLEDVRSLIEHDEALATPGRLSAETLLPRQKDVSIGAGLMLIGGIVAVLWGFIIGTGPLDVLLPQAFLILGFTLAFILLFFNPLVRTLHKFFSGTEEKPRDLSRQQTGINLGAILMFIGTLKAMLLAPLMNLGNRGAATLLLMTGGFLLVLVLRWLIQAVYRLLFKTTASSHEAESAIDAAELTARLAPAAYGGNLPPARSITPDDNAASEMKRGNVAQPVSVTEYTTELLDKE